ncbi:MAG: hypothetical protein M3Q75_01065 [Gemmatimonadota bacterium]|nr:hypothetical protein [Gemmatimonadota bacterium]
MTAVKNLARGSAAKTLPVGEAKKKVLGFLGQGWKVTPAMAAVERSTETYRDWMRSDPAFKDQVTGLRAVATAARRRGADGATVVPDFPEFSATYLNTPLPELHLRMWDMMCGREPRTLHPAIRFQKGRDNFLLANFPPEFGKSTTWNMNYATWRICKDPNVRIIIVSKSLGMAKKFLGGIKQRLTGNQFRDLQVAFAPEGGWKGSEGSWTATEIYVSGRGSGEKDPTVQALGVGGQIYGARADVVICDDVVDLGNAGMWESQTNWLGQEAITRLTPDGHMIILGTRVAPVDLYAKLREQQEWDSEGPIYTYLAQPAVLEAGDHPNDWTCLWPEKWPGIQLARRKASLGADSRWALVFQQQDVLDNAVFPPHAVKCAIDGMRSAGNLESCGPHSRPMRGMYVVAGLDPATVGCTAIIVSALDRQTRKRYVMDGFNKANCTPALMKDTIKRLTLTHRVQEWVIERNAFQRFLTQDDELRSWLNAHGALLREHYTIGQNKFDEDYGVAAMAPLFESCWEHTEEGPMRRDGGGLIDLPNPAMAGFCTDLIEQLVTWQPQARKRQLTDMVMALWFTEIAFRRILDNSSSMPDHMPNRFATRGGRRQRHVVDLLALETSMADEDLVMTA